MIATIMPSCCDYLAFSLRARLVPYPWRYGSAYLQGYTFLEFDKNIFTHLFCLVVLIVPPFVTPYADPIGRVWTRDSTVI